MGFFCAARPNCLCWFGACMEQALSARGGKALEEGKEEKEAVYDRLYSNAIRSERLRKEVLSRIKVQEELQGCTFAPQVSRVWSRVRGRAGVCTCVCELRDANVRFFWGGEREGRAVRVLRLQVGWHLHDCGSTATSGQCTTTNTRATHPSDYSRTAGCAPGCSCWPSTRAPRLRAADSRWIGTMAGAAHRPRRRANASAAAQHCPQRCLRTCKRGVVGGVEHLELRQAQQPGGKRAAEPVRADVERLKARQAACMAQAPGISTWCMRLPMQQQLQQCGHRCMLPQPQPGAHRRSLVSCPSSRCRRC